MRRPRTPLLRGLIMQLFAFIVLPLTLLLPSQRNGTNSAGIHAYELTGTTHCA
jgi:hypothetical protein